VVRVAVGWDGAHVLQVLRGNGVEGHDMHLPVIGRSIRGRNVLNSEPGIIEGRVMVDGRTSFETEQLPEAVRDVFRGVAYVVARAAARSNGRYDLNAIQAILTENGRSEMVVGRTDLISRGDYDGYRIHAG